ncbi:hypothetical protein ACVWXN_010175 [Bradyrhizobium sp. i1.4.4]|uniref:hypothetical protein n=1 Tax=Bradyrhizobium sp. LA6.10 TaxID=3156318 RepID=UPI0033971EF8
MVGQAKQKKIALKQMVAHEPRCIYCTAPPSTIEHMPPITFFRGRLRPKGMEFAACQECNDGTRGADVVASFFARMDRQGDNQLISEAMNNRQMLQMRAPGVLDELFNPQKEDRVWVKRNGILQEMARIKADGPVTRIHLHVFAAKFGMALYRHHIGEALPPEGGVQTNVFMNAGLAQNSAEHMLKILPAFNSLQQGKFWPTDQFAYRYNSDGKMIVAALASFHANLHLFVIATSQIQMFRLPLYPDSELIHTGELVTRLKAA